MFQRSSLLFGFFVINYIQFFRINDLHSLEELVKIEAHDGEVLCVEYSNCEDPRKKYLTSASRDRLIHVFSVDEASNVLVYLLTLQMNCPMHDIK